MQTQAIISNSLEKARAKEDSAKSYLGAIGRFFGFDFLYVSFLMIFFFKYTALFSPIQSVIDLTATLFVLLVMGWGAIIVQRKYRKNTFSPILLPPLFLLGWLLFTLLYSIDFRHGWFHTLFYLPTALVTFLIGYFIIAPDDRRVRNFFLWLILFSCFLAYLNVESYYSDKGLAKYWIRADLDAWSSYIDRSLVITSGAAVLVFYLFNRSSLSYFYARFLRIRHICIFLTVLFFWGVLHGGSRQGFVLFLSIPLMMYFLLYLSKRSAERLYISVLMIFFSLVVFFLGYHFIGDLFQTSVYRRTIDDIEHHGFSPMRLELWNLSWLLLQENPVTGLGFGGFKEAIGNFGHHTYPHNLFLEVWLELGLPGLLGLFVWIALFCKGGLTVLQRKQDYLFVPIVLLAVLWFLSLQVSGSWVESRFTAAFAGILAGRIAMGTSRNRLGNSRKQPLRAAREGVLSVAEGRLNGR